MVSVRIKEWNRGQPVEWNSGRFSSSTSEREKRRDGVRWVILCRSTLDSTINGPRIRGNMHQTSDDGDLGVDITHGVADEARRA